VPVLGFLTVAYFSSGPLLPRLRGLATTLWRPLMVLAVITIGYLAYYLSQVGTTPTWASSRLTGQIGDSMLGTAFLSGSVGGPWRWWSAANSTAYVDPPALGVHISWVLVALVVSYGYLTRVCTLRAWVLLFGYLLVLWALVVASPAPAFGPVVGLDYRFLTDAACVLTLCLALAFMRVEQASQSSHQRSDPYIKIRVSGPVTVALVAVICASGVMSSAKYVTIIHAGNRSETFLAKLDDELASQGAVDLVDTVVPEDVMSTLAAPNNTVRRLVTLLSDEVSYPSVSANLVVVTSDGGLRQAAIAPVVSANSGPTPDCGWLVRETGQSVQLTEPTPRYESWTRIGYLSSQDTPVVVTAGEIRVETTLIFQGDGDI
jgi:hypothetical protein